LVEDPSGWVKAAQAGDREAFERLVERYGRPLLRYLQTLTGSAANADDIAQETWLQAYRGISAVNDPALFYSWLVKIAYHRHLRWARNRKPVVELDPELMTQPSSSENTRLDGLTDAVRNAVVKLPEDQRTVVALRFGEGLSHAEIAEITGDEVATVRWRLFMARQALQKILKDWQ
jgi:RNA polymerase sigma-70 factor (ECF subfamily)